MSEQAKKKFNWLYIHITVMFVIMFGFHFLPPIGTITPMGMKMIGVFLAVLYGWTACGMLWPSMMGMLGVALSGEMTMAEFVKTSFGSETIIFILFLLIFSGVVEEVGLINYISNKIISFHFLNKRPWLFTTFILIGTWIAGAFINMFLAIVVFWSISYIVSDRFGFKPYDKWPTLMIIGIPLISLIGGAVMPYQPVTLVILSTYSAASGVPMNFLKYILFSLPMTLLIVVFYVLICRFVFRPDLKELKNISVDFADPKALTLTVKQKWALLFLAIFIFFMIAPSMLPEDWAISAFINQIGLVGALFLLIIIMHWIKVDGEVFIDFGKMTHNINWDVFMIMAFVIPFASILTSDETGIKAAIVTGMQPLLAGHSMIVFSVLTLLIATLLTNIANNMVIGAIFTTLIFTIGTSMSMDIAPVIAVLSVLCNLAIATPAASPAAAMCFANSKWCRAKDAYKYGIIIVLLCFIFTAAAGLIWANIVY